MNSLFRSLIAIVYAMTVILSFGVMSQARSYPSAPFVSQSHLHSLLLQREGHKITQKRVVAFSLRSIPKPTPNPTQNKLKLAKGAKKRN
ncbi:hypothetical protein VIGAN_06060000 [Vigna angularis var. angularis]|uniref:Uncharacterized protein n=1 Tax=Vigna angularis var. angularis TaxID=157739 RepID=A0A0S3S9Y7_PHAAN|nr:hypothetical protein VIGAN_06060000 [Vigna angularis var. angularis]